MQRSERKRRRWWRALLVGVPLAVVVFALGFPLLYAVATPEQRGPIRRLPPVPPGSYSVIVADWGYHTAIVVEQPRDWALGPPDEERAPFLEYAWGDRRFFMESDYRPHAVFATLVLPTESVLYQDGRPRPPSLAGARAVFARRVDAAALHRLLLDLERSFQRGPDEKRLSPYAATPGFGGRFYPAYGRYLWTRNCNWWTVMRLNAAQLAGGARGVVFSGQVKSRLSDFAVATFDVPVDQSR
jgi:hypothetical protein